MRMTQADAERHNARVAKKSPYTPDEALAEVQSRSSERALHDEIEAECKRRGWYYVHSRMDRATTTAKGVPDFIIAARNGRTFWIEAKGRLTKLTAEQAGAIQWLSNFGHRTAVVRSIGEFISIIDA